MIDSVNISSAVQAGVSQHDADWALSMFSFRWFESTLTERLYAIRDYLGGMEPLAAAAELSVSGLKAWLREKPAEPGFLKILALSNATGISLDYIARGRPANHQDTLVEERRYELARATTNATSANPDRRAILAEIKRQLDMQWETYLASFAAAPATPVAEPVVRIAPLYPNESNVGTARVWKFDPLPIGFSQAFLDTITDDADAISYDIIAGDVMAPLMPAGSVVLVDRRDVELTSGCIYAFSFPEELVYRRFFRQSNGLAELICDNAHYPSQSLDPIQLSQLNVRGRAIWVGATV